MALQLSPCQQEDHITCLAISSDSSILASGSLDHSISYSSPSSPVSTPYIIPRAHDSPVLCLCWSSLQFGNILASGSADGSIKLWISSQDETRRSWKSTALLSEARGSIRKIEFSPSEFGLKLATISGDSTLRIYECFDTSKLVEWALVEEIDLSNNYPSSTTSLSTGSGPIKGFDPASPSKQTSSNPINLSPGSSSIGTIERKVSNIESAGGWSLAWCKEAWWGERIAVSSGTSGIIRVSEEFKK